MLSMLFVSRRSASGLQCFSASWIGAGVDTLSILFDSEIIRTSLRLNFTALTKCCAQCFTV